MEILRDVEILREHGPFQLLGKRVLFSWLLIPKPVLKVSKECSGFRVSVGAVAANAV